jgi:hypothetical protein
LSPVIPDPGCQKILSNPVLGLPVVREGKMFGVPAFYVGKKLFACVYGDVIGVKVPQDLAAHLVDSSGFAPFQPYGKAKMREWVQFSCSPAEEIPDYQDVLLAAYHFVRGDGRE